MLNLNAASQFRKDCDRCISRGYNMTLLMEILAVLRVPAALPESNRNHFLAGKWAGHQECCIQPDWLLIYRIEGNDLYLERTGTYADLL